MLLAHTISENCLVYENCKQRNSAICAGHGLGRAPLGHETNACPRVVVSIDGSNRKLGDWWQLIRRAQITVASGRYSSNRGCVSGRIHGLNLFGAVPDFEISDCFWVPANLNPAPRESCFGLRNSSKFYREDGACCVGVAIEKVKQYWNLCKVRSIFL